MLLLEAGNFRVELIGVRVLFSPGGSKRPQVQQGPSYAEQKAQEDAARDEAARKARMEAGQRQGARATLLTSPELNTEFGASPTRRRTLFGGA